MFKPEASRKSQMFLAALMWSAVGLFLCTRGLLNILQIDDDLKFLWIVASMVGGLFKAKMVLEKTAMSISRRIQSRGEPSCLFGFLSVKNWVLIIAMIFLGICLRASPLSRLFVWSIYIAIGAALFSSSRILWGRWQKFA